MKKNKGENELINLNDLAKEAYIVAKKRELNGAFIKTAPIDILKHCAGEVMEATEAYCDFAYEMTDEFEEKFQNEVADIMVCCLIMSGYMGFDIEKAINRVMEKNRLRAEKHGDKL